MLSRWSPHRRTRRDTRNPQVWIRYDRLFRQSAAVNPALEWHRREPNLWLMATSDFAFPSASWPSPQVRQYQPSAASTSVNSSDEPCWRFNRGVCPFAEARCRYRHVCRQCLSAGHMARDCPKVQLPSRHPAPHDAIGDR